MTADFLVIGGGIAGAAAAGRLSHLGTVVLAEAEDRLGYHASGRSAALFEASYGLPAVRALNRASRDEHDDRGVLSPRGLMLVGREDERAAFLDDAAAMGLEEIAAAAALAAVPLLSPAAVAFAAMGRNAWDIDTDRLMQSFLREARANGARVLTGARVGSLARTGPGWAAATPAGTIEARLVVNAAGAWVDEVAALAGLRRLGFTPLRRSMARIAVPGGHDARGWPMVFGVGEGWYAKPDAGALIVSPAEEDPAEPHDAFPDDMVLAEGLARFEAMTAAPVTRLLASWAGLRTFAPDRVLVIGPDPAEPAFLWAAGQGGYGFQTAPAASRLLADLVAGRAPDLDAATVAALSPARFG
ncbi:MAG: FAD-binding oxidoreductase [Rhodobacteraceae bacterium]|jgi:glycine/D-amino acid oxidase-like deaminating enzyme|nr:FAD-binding oxidoreductase [Paracoccaceae bacterium]